MVSSPPAPVSSTPVLTWHGMVTVSLYPARVSLDLLVSPPRAPDTLSPTSSFLFAASASIPAEASTGQIKTPGSHQTLGPRPSSCNLNGCGPLNLYIAQQVPRQSQTSILVNKAPRPLCAASNSVCPMYPGTLGRMGLGCHVGLHKSSTFGSDRPASAASPDPVLDAASHS